MFLGCLAISLGFRINGSKIIGCEVSYKCSILWNHLFDFTEKVLWHFRKVFIHLSNIFTNRILLYIFLCQMFSWCSFWNSHKKQEWRIFSLLSTSSRPIYLNDKANQVQVNYEKVNKRSKSLSAAHYASKSRNWWFIHHECRVWIS